MVSAAFERFRLSFFEDPDSARNGLDQAALAELVGAERAHGEDMLIAFLPDTRAVIGLGVLRARRAEPAITAIFESAEREQRGAKEAGFEYWSSAALVDIAKALWLIRPDPRWREAIVDMLAHGEFDGRRQEAAQALSDVRDPAVDPPLIRALDDPEPLVRHHAARSLLALRGFHIDILKPDAMTIRVMADDAVRREAGKRDILAAIAGEPISR
jgi:HEAT repeat protein